MATPFKIIKHTLPAQHIRESPQSIQGRQEVYEPLWEDLYAELKKQSVPLRGI
jgi:hypothetical protein